MDKLIKNVTAKDIKNAVEVMKNLKNNFCKNRVDILTERKKFNRDHCEGCPMVYWDEELGFCCSFREIDKMADRIKTMFKV